MSSCRLEETDEDEREDEAGLRFGHAAVFGHWQTLNSWDDLFSFQDLSKVYKAAIKVMETSIQGAQDPQGRTRSAMAGFITEPTQHVWQLWQVHSTASSLVCQ